MSQYTDRMAELKRELFAIQKERDNMIWDNGGFGKFPLTMKEIDRRISKLQDMYAQNALWEETRNKK